MNDLRRVPTEELEAELVRRARGQWKTRPDQPIPHCDECDNFIPYTAGEEVPANFNPCSKGHSMRFKVPHSMGDAHSGNWGFYLPGCKDRAVSRGAARGRAMETEK